MDYQELEDKLTEVKIISCSQCSFDEGQCYVKDYTESFCKRAKQQIIQVIVDAGLGTAEPLNIPENPYKEDFRAGRAFGRASDFIDNMDYVKDLNPHGAFKPLEEGK